MRQRFAPSPTGPLHLGHAFSALTCWDQTQAGGGAFLLRVEDIDHTRCRPAFERTNLEDLHWLGLRWPTPVRRQSEHLNAYQDALNHLIEKDICYACQCTRGDIKAALSAPQETTAPSDAAGPDGPIYPGTCRHRPAHLASKQDAIRLNMARAISSLGGAEAVNRLMFTETGGDQPVVHHLDADTLLTACGDIVLARRDIGTSYHMAVVVDDAAQKITHVTRGRDIFAATFLHRLLQALLNLPTPVYHHHRLIRNDTGKRLAKRDDARAIAKYRAGGDTPADIRARLGL